MKQFTKIACLTIGAYYTLVALALLFAPHWFYDAFAPIGAFNGHFLGDVGAFTLPLGIGLFVAARAPHRYRALIALAAAASVVHLLNHLVDGAEALPIFVGTIASLVAVALALTGATWGAWSTGNVASSSHSPDVL